jgi:signal transduction histidine kinase
MAAVSPGAKPGPVGCGGDDTPRWWWAVFVVAIVLCLIYTAISPDRVVLRTVVYAGGEIAAIAGIIAGVRRYRPEAPRVWYLLAGALGAWLIGDVIWGAYQIADRDPLPSIADVFYLAGYPLFVAALVMATRKRARRLDQRTVIDASLITMAGGFLAWVYLIDPVVSDPAYEGGAELVTVAYPIADLLLLAAAARFIVGVQWDVGALRALVGALVFTLVGDTIYALSSVGVTDLRVADTLLLAGVLLLGLAGLHPTMTAFTRRQSALYETNDGFRLVVVAGAGLLVPTVVLVQDLRSEPLHLVASLITTCVLAGLFVIRFEYVTLLTRRAADRERVLSRYVAELLGADAGEDLYPIAERAASMLVNNGEAVVGSAPPAHDESLALPVSVRGEVRAHLVVKAPRVQLAKGRRALETVATELSLALERQQLIAGEQEAARRLAEQNERLRELDRMKDQFVSSVSHELRSPLTSIVGYLELLLDGEVGELDEEQRRFLEVVDRNCNRLTTLVDDILFIARVDAGRLSLDLQPVDLGELAAAAVESAGPVARREGVDLRLDAEPGMPPVVADATRMTQLLDNLISNAVKFTPRGGTVTVAVAKRDDFAHLEVRDTGVGIPREELDRLFDRFFRASTAAVASGTGLGLSIVKSIVGAHRGTISVESEVGAGTTVVVDLPLRARPMAAAEAATDKEPVRERLRAN